MQLNEILEENSIKTISQKTKISDTNLEALFNANFEVLQKTKALGFLAIVEREYRADLSSLREEALEYYGANREERGYSPRQYIDEEKKGKSKLFIFVVFGLLIYATWYFLTQFDKNNLSGRIHFIDEGKLESFIGADETKEDQTAADLSIVTVTTKEDKQTGIQKQENKEEQSNAVNVSALVASLVEESSEAAAIESVDSISIIPVKKLWFGLVNIETKEREHHAIEKPYALDVSAKSWLVATSSAPFSLLDGEKKEAFNDAKEHYFKIDKNGIEMLSKSEYVEQGGWHQW